MNTPKKEDIIAEATKLYFEQNREVDCYNTPEICELREAGLLLEARRKLMSNPTSTNQRQEYMIANSSKCILKMNGGEKEMSNTVRDWQQKDPYLIDVDGFLKSLENKQNEIHVRAKVEACASIMGGNRNDGYEIWLEIPYEKIPESYKTQDSFKQQEARIKQLTEQITDTLTKIGYGQEAWSRLFNKGEPEPEYAKDKLIPGSTTIFQYHRFKMPEPPEATVEDEKQLREYVHKRMHDFGIFSMDECSTSEKKYVFENSKSHEEPNVSVGRQIVVASLDKANPKEYADALIECEVEQRLKPFKEGTWYYFGDESHCGENVRQNASLMWRIAETLKPLLDIWSVHKDYDMRSLYLGVNPKSKEPRIPPFCVSNYSTKRSIHEAYQYDHTIREVETGFDSSQEDVLAELQTLTRAMLMENVPNIDDMFEDDYVWILNEDEPMLIMGIYRASIPLVLAYLKEGVQEWDPQYDESIMRNGGLEIVHPYLRERRMLRFNDDIYWSEEALVLKELYYRKYELAELEPLKNDELKTICEAKNLKAGHRRDDMIKAIIEANEQAQAEPEPDSESDDWKDVLQ